MSLRCPPPGDLDPWPTLLGSQAPTNAIAAPKSSTSLKPSTNACVGFAPAAEARARGSLEDRSEPGHAEGCAELAEGVVAAGGHAATFRADHSQSSRRQKRVDEAQSCRPPQELVVTTKNSGQIGWRTRREHPSLILTAVKAV